MWNTDLLSTAGLLSPNVSLQKPPFALQTAFSSKSLATQMPVCLLPLSRKNNSPFTLRTETGWKNMQNRISYTRIAVLGRKRSTATANWNWQFHTWPTHIFIHSFLQMCSPRRASSRALRVDGTMQFLSSGSHSLATKGDPVFITRMLENLEMPNSCDQGALRSSHATFQIHG